MDRQEEIQGKGDLQSSSRTEAQKAHERSPQNGHYELEQAQIESIVDATKNFGSFYLFKTIAEEIKLLPILRKIFPNIYMEIFSLVCFLIESQEPIMYCKEWFAETETFDNAKILTSQYISRILEEIDDSNRNDFFEQWIKNINESEYIALDIASISSYSELLEGCEFGYNIDHEKLRQINLCMLFGEGCMLPVYEKFYFGSIHDVSTLKTTIDEIKSIVQNTKFHFVMDKGFFSKNNIDKMLDPNEDIKFLISIPFTSKFAKTQIERERYNIDKLCNTIITSNDTIRGIYRLRSWKTENRDTKIHTHIFYNPLKAITEKNELYKFVTELRDEAVKDPDNKVLEKQFKKYLVIKKETENNNYCSVEIREDIVEEKLTTCGWMVLISNYIEDSKKALSIYRDKDVVEKSFDRLKNSLDFNRLRVHGDTRMKNKIFIGFLSSIVISAIHQKMISAKLYKKYTMHELVLKLKKLKITKVRQKKILQPISKEQREIFKSLSIALPEFSSQEHCSRAEVV
ncbi:MAG: IS1634 family transposase [Desulfovibrio sp.]|nr:IS1634 family transposase [Desulfovibrio sp.]